MIAAQVAEEGKRSMLLQGTKKPTRRKSLQTSHRSFRGTERSGKAGHRRAKGKRDMFMKMRDPHWKLLVLVGTVAILGTVTIDILVIITERKDGGGPFLRRSTSV
jgi:hypothetical protein